MQQSEISPTRDGVNVLLALFMRASLGRMKRKDRDAIVAEISSSLDLFADPTVRSIGSARDVQLTSELIAAAARWSSIKGLLSRP